MTAPRWWVPLLLAALFGMHGIQCMDAGGSMAMPAAVAITASSPVNGAQVTGQVKASPTAAHGTDEVQGQALRAAAGAGDHHDPAGLVDHLWALCLAVLSAGLAALALLLSRARPGLRADLRHRAHRWLSGLDPPRPPDIHSLCVLRI